MFKRLFLKIRNLIEESVLTLIALLVIIIGITGYVIFMTYVFVILLLILVAWAAREVISQAVKSLSRHKK